MIHYNNTPPLLTSCSSAQQHSVCASSNKSIRKRVYNLLNFSIISGIYTRTTVMDYCYKHVTFFTCLLLLGWASVQNTVAQRRPFGETEGYMSFGIQLNAMNFKGDVYSDLSLTRPGVFLHATRKLGERVHARLSIGVGRIMGNDIKAEENSFKYARNLNFRNDLKEITLVGTYDIAGSPGRFFRRRGFTPYVLGGIGIVHHSPKGHAEATSAARWTDLQALGTEGQGRPGYDTPYSKVQVVVPLGVGLRWKLNRRWDFAIEASVRLSLTDYLDDVGGNFVDPSDLNSDLAKSFANRSFEAIGAINRTPRNVGQLREQYGSTTYTGFDGNAYENLNNLGVGDARGKKGKDIYIVTGFHFTYIIDTGLSCPQLRW